MAFTGGIPGIFLRDFGLTVSIAVLVSVVEAFTLAPMLSAHFFKQSSQAEIDRRRRSLFGRLLDGLNGSYSGLLHWSLNHRWAVVVISCLLLGGTGMLTRGMVFSFIPPQDSGQLTVAIELQPGARLAETDKAAQAVEKVLLANRETVDNVFTTVGASDGSVSGASLVAKLRQRGQTDAAIARLRPEIAQALPGTKFSITKQDSSSLGTGSSGLMGQAVSFSIQGSDFKLLDRVSAEVLTRLQQVPGVVDADRSIKAGRPQRSVLVDRAKAADLGLTSAQVGATLRALVNGESVGSLRTADKDVDIIVRLAAGDRESPEAIMGLPIVTPRGVQVPLGTFATMVQSSEQSVIQRENRQRQVSVGASYQGRDLGSVMADAQAAVAAMSLPEGVTIKTAGQAKYTDEMVSSLGFAMGLAVLFVYMILASQFGSFIHPFTIMLALPFSVVGALVALVVARFNFDMLAMIGMILLMGLVTKNSILLVDFTNQLKRRGVSTREAILQAGPIRLRPILMTTLSMIFGMVPVAIGLGAGAELRRGMGITVIGGLIASTLLTLVVVPVAYSLIDDLTRLVRRSPATVAPAGALRDFATVVAASDDVPGNGATHVADSLESVLERPVDGQGDGKRR
jgi:hydrophobic/amphiphilic exporter-1 (mainly G- bacteria), HAE1 family